MKVIALLLSLLFVAAAWSQLGLLSLLIIPFAVLFLLMSLAPVMEEDLYHASSQPSRQM